MHMSAIKVEPRHRKFDLDQEVLEKIDRCTALW